MKIMLITAGSRGDVEPFAAFARGAQAAGHKVRLALPDNSGVDLSGLDAISLGADFSAMIADQGVSPLTAMRSFRSTVKPVMRAVIVNSARATREFAPDVLMYHPKIVSAPLVADHLGIPHIVVEAVPVTTPTRAFAAPGTTTASLGGAVNKLTYQAMGAAAGMFREELSEAAALLGVSATSASAPAATMVTVSPHLLARPDDWPESVHLTGPWTAPATERALDTALAEFIAEPFV
ncbi:glycosyltransferase [Microbacterium marmarense]|uniref:Glycosyltransferase n=1 Tax=Microbacterium marmarense TaxID=3122051 RepID=A0ABU8LRC9_9MICO